MTRRQILAAVASLLLIVGLAAVFSGWLGGPPWGPVQPRAVELFPSGYWDAVGYLEYEPTSGGYWALFDRPFGPSSAVQPKAVAVLRPSNVDTAAIAALQGKYVWAYGPPEVVVIQGAATILVDRIAVTPEP